jgi:cytochrome c oxidase assembly protein subunit 15
LQRPLSQAVAPSSAGPLIFRLLILAAIVAAFSQITLGAFVRVLDAGLACGDDWPLCDGSWIPPFTKEVILEYTHRLTAVLLGIFVLAAVVSVWRLHRQNKVVFRFTLGAFVLVIVAGAFGAATVKSELGWGLRLIHLALAEALLATLAVALVGVWPVKNAPFNSPSASTMAAGTMAIVLMTVSTFVVLVSGSVIIGLEASTACGSWPSCSGSTFIPSGDSKFAIHMAHRIVAGVAGLLIVGTAVWTWRMREWWPGVGVASVLLIVMLVGQVFLGAANPWSGFADGWKALHVAAATATWLATAVLAALILVPRFSADSGPDPGAERFRGLAALTQ